MVIKFYKEIKPQELPNTRNSFIEKKLDSKAIFVQTSKKEKRFPFEGIDEFLMALSRLHRLFINKAF